MMMQLLETVEEVRWKYKISGLLIWVRPAKFVAGAG